jgi:hypothetical protein
MKFWCFQLTQYQYASAVPTTGCGSPVRPLQSWSDPGLAEHQISCAHYLPVLTIKFKCVCEHVRIYVLTVRELRSSGWYAG